MAFKAVDIGMCPGKRKHSGIVVKDHISITCRMAGEASLVLVSVALNPHVLIVCFLILVASYTRKQIPLAGSIMALHALVPYAFVLSVVHGKVHAIVVKGGRLPRPFIVALCTFCWKLQLQVIWILGTDIIRIMASVAGIGCIDVCTVVACRTILRNKSVGTVEGIKCIVVRELCRTPAGIRSVAYHTIGAQPQ